MTNETEPQTYSAFVGNRLLAGGALPDVLTVAKRHYDVSNVPVLLFEDWSGRQVDFNLSGSSRDVLQRAEPASQKAGRGRPRLGVQSREVSLLPRHWEWLEENPAGISAAIRRLVDEARKRETGADKARRMRDATSRFMWAMAGNLPNFEETARALYAKEIAAMESLVAQWPADVRDHVLRMAREAERLEAHAA